jgi:hypothetical protein
MAITSISEETIAMSEPALYVSPFRTGTYDATIINRHDDGTVDIHVAIPGVSEVVKLRRLEYGPDKRVRPI